MQTNSNHSRPLRIIGAACGRGGPDPRCAEGPEALRAAGLVEHLSRNWPDVAWEETLSCGAPGMTALEAVAELCPRLAQQTFDAVNEGALPLVLSGDHSCAVGTWAGISQALKPRGALGLIWIDAHLDSHTPATTPSGALHGMPLAALMGFGEPSLTECGGPGPKLFARNLCIIGARSYEAEEVRFLDEIGARVFYMAEVNRRGTAAVMRDALHLVQADTAGFGISIDLDAIDPVEAPGVGTPAARGIRSAGLREALVDIGLHPGLAGIEISEYNPARDREGKTSRLVFDLLEEMLGVPDTPVAAQVCALTDPAIARKMR